MAFKIVQSNTFQRQITQVAGCRGLTDMEMDFKISTSVERKSQCNIFSSFFCANLVKLQSDIKVLASGFE